MAAGGTILNCISIKTEAAASNKDLHCWYFLDLQKPILIRRKVYLNDGIMHPTGVNPIKAPSFLEF